MELWRQRKMSHVGCRAELIDSRDRAHVYLDEVAKQERVENEMLQQKNAAHVLADLSWSRPWLPPTELESAWLSQWAMSEVAPDLPVGTSPLCSMEEAAPSILEGLQRDSILRRYKVLVYDGPSKTGKSERARHWFGSNRTLVVQCQGVDQPCLLDWNPSEHVAILYEEANWSLMWQNRMLMQSGPLPVRLGQSPTNQASYSLHVFRIPMMLVTNDFWKGCDDDEARDWITQNMCYRLITERQWQD